MCSKKLLIGCGMLIAAVVILVIAGIVAGSLLIPEVSQQMTAGRDSTNVNVTLPVNGATLRINQPVTVFVDAFGDQPIQSIELMVNGVPLPNGFPTTAGETKMMSTWAFTPDKEGLYTLIASAKTDSGLNSISNAVNINIVPADQVPLPLVDGVSPTIPAMSEETFKTALTGGTSAPPPPGFNDQGGMDYPPPPPMPGENDVPDEPAGQPGGSLIPIKYSLWAENITKNFISVNPPAAPKLDGGAKGCDSILVVQDNSADEIGFFLYRLDPGKQTFNRVAILDGKPGKSSFSYHDPGLALGSYSYYLSALNSAGEASGNLISVQIKDGQCAKPEPKTLGFESFKMTTKTPVGQVYCYISAEGSPWRRVPEGKDSFIPSANGVFDLNQYLGPLPLPVPPKTQVTINIECWGWNGDTLIYLGSSQQSWSPNNTLVLAAQYFDITGIGGGQKMMSGEYPPTDKISIPYNLHFSKNKLDNKQDCKTHSADLSDEINCMSKTTSEFGVLFWDWNRYGNCNPGAQFCDMKYQDADGFIIYRNDHQAWDTKHSSRSTWSTMGFTSWHPEFIIYVRAYSEKYGESYDSTHVFLPNPDLEVTITIKPTLYEMRHWFNPLSGKEPPEWYIHPLNGELYSGYAFDNFGDTRVNGRVVFHVPKWYEQLITSAKLEWNNASIFSKGAGANEVLLNCNIQLSYFIPNAVREDLILPLFSKNSVSFDVSEPVKLASLYPDSIIEFWFLFPDPTERAPGVRPDVCMLNIKDVSLTYLAEKLN